MKKIYLCALALSIGSLSFGQVKNFANSPTKAMLRTDDSTPAAIKNTSANDKAPGTVIWSEDFTGGFPAGWTKGGATNAGADWVINSAALSSTYTSTGPIASTSGGNHMLYFGETISPIADRDAWFQTTAIALTGQPSVSVRFQQKFRLCCASSAALDLEVSSDPTFASNVQTFNARGAVAINAMSADPEITTFNISSAFGGFTGNIYLRFHWNLGASHYFWMVDDIEVIESENNDLIAFNEFYGALLVPYTRIPLTQIQPFDFAMETTNVGAIDQTNTILTADVNGGLYTGTSTPVTVLAMASGGTVAGTSDSLFTTTQFTPPPTVGVPFNVTLTISSDSTDFSPTNNSATFSPFEVSDSTYALDDYGTTPGAGGGLDNSTTPPSAEFEAGNFYDIVANTFARSIDVYIGTGTPAGTAIESVLYDFTTGSFVQVDRSSIYITTAGDVGTMVNLPLPLAPALTAGNSYFAAVHAFTEFNYGTSGSSPGPSSPGGVMSLVYYPNMTTPATGQNYYTSRTPMIRLNVRLSVGVEDAKVENSNFSVYPNPSNGVFNITLNGSSNVNLTVKNVVGKTIINKIIAVNGQTTETISLADYSKGIYFLTIDNKTVKLIVE